MYKHSVLLEIKENKWGILEYGTTIHLVKLERFLKDSTIRKSSLTNNWKKYIEDNNEDVLFIGVVDNENFRKRCDKNEIRIHTKRCMFNENDI